MESLDFLSLQLFMDSNSNQSLRSKDADWIDQLIIKLPILEYTSRQSCPSYSKMGKRHLYLYDLILMHSQSFSFSLLSFSLSPSSPPPNPHSHRQTPFWAHSSNSPSLNSNLKLYFSYCSLRERKQGRWEKDQVISVTVTAGTACILALFRP